MIKPQMYINLSQTLGIIGVVFLISQYLMYCRDAEGIQKKSFKERIQRDITGVIFRKKPDNTIYY